MIVIRRNQHGIALNPYEYMMDDERVCNFEDKQTALKYIEKRGDDMDIRDENGELSEDMLWDNYGVELHEIDKAQLAQLKEEVTNNDGKPEA